jgi:hypothetical protein
MIPNAVELRSYGPIRFGESQRFLFRTTEEVGLEIRLYIVPQSFSWIGIDNRRGSI